MFFGNQGHPTQPPGNNSENRKRGWQKRGSTIFANGPGLDDQWSIFVVPAITKALSALLVDESVPPPFEQPPSRRVPRPFDIETFPDSALVRKMALTRGQSAETGSSVFHEWTIDGSFCFGMEPK